MANTYSGDPAHSLADAVRFRIDDTDTTTYEFEDAEVAYALAQNDDQVLASAIYLCGVLIARYANKRDRSVGPMSVTYSSQHARWIETRDVLLKEQKYGTTGVGRAAPIELFGGGDTLLGGDDTSLSYNEGEGQSVT